MFAIVFLSVSVANTMVFAFCVESLPDSADLRKDDVKRRRHSDSDASIRLATALSRNVKPSLLFLFKKRKECIIISIFLYDLFLFFFFCIG